MVLVTNQAIQFSIFFFDINHIATIEEEVVIASHVGTSLSVFVSINLKTKKPSKKVPIDVRFC